MRYGIPLLGQRVAPRITSSESILLVTIKNHRITGKEIVHLDAATWIDLPTFLAPFHVNTLVCGGIDQRSKKDLLTNAVDIIENVACDIEGVLRALVTGSLHSGFGFGGPTNRAGQAGDDLTDNAHEGLGAALDKKNLLGVLSEIDCVTCRNRLCIQGRTCPALEFLSIPDADASAQAMLDAAADISFEKERTLCRISELVYFCLEMKYHKIGIAFCTDLLEPTEILVQLLRRFFDVYPVICKVGGVSILDPFTGADRIADRKIFGLAACNPLGQAEILNRLDTDLNIMVGLCMGVDCVFTKASQAPVTTLFVKDKSLANNPIGALYSEYYLKEVTQTSVNKS